MQMTFDYPLLHWILISLIGISGIFLMLWAAWQLRRKHLLRCCVGASSGAALLGIFSFFLLIISNLYTYGRMTDEQILATVHIQQLAEQRFLLSMDFANDRSRQIFELKGDEWQLDARMLKWKYPVAWLGLDAHYRLERISGRYTDIEAERKKPRSVYALSDSRGPDVWPIIREYQRYIPLIDAVYGSASYLPMRDGAEYQISLSHSGLLARTMNARAEDSVTNWR